MKTGTLARRCTFQKPFAVKFDALPELVRKSLGALGGIQPVTPELEALRRSTIKLVLTRHEQAAAFMAATHGRLTGRAGVCLSTLGPGALNLATGAAFALLGAMPMIMITGQKGKQTPTGRVQCDAQNRTHAAQQNSPLLPAVPRFAGIDPLADLPADITRPSASPGTRDAIRCPCAR